MLFVIDHVGMDMYVLAPKGSTMPPLNAVCINQWH